MLTQIPRYTPPLGVQNDFDGCSFECPPFPWSLTRKVSKCHFHLNVNLMAASLKLAWMLICCERAMSGGVTKNQITFICIFFHSLQSLSQIADSFWLVSKQCCLFSAHQAVWQLKKALASYSSQAQSVSLTLPPSFVIVFVFALHFTGQKGENQMLWLLQLVFSDSWTVGMTMSLVQKNYMFI